MSCPASVVKTERCEDNHDVLSTSSPLPLTRDYCFCPHGFISHSHGHFHCRQCGESFKFLSQVNRHEKSHKELFSSSRNTPTAKTELTGTSEDSSRKLDYNGEIHLADKTHSSGKNLCDCEMCAMIICNFKRQLMAVIILLLLYKH